MKYLTRNELKQALYYLEMSVNYAGVSELSAQLKLYDVNGGWIATVGPTTDGGYGLILEEDNE